MGRAADSVERSLEHLFEHRRPVTAGSFVFVLSDFLDPPSRETWLTAVEHLWDVIPVVIQDPTWEQSFPDVSGIVVPLRDARTGRVTHVRLTKKEAAARKRAHEERLLALIDELALLDLDPVLISSSEPSEVLASFLDWTEFRRARRGVMALNRAALARRPAVCSCWPSRRAPSSICADSGGNNARLRPLRAGPSSRTGSSSSATPSGRGSTSLSTGARSIRRRSRCASTFGAWRRVGPPEVTRADAGSSSLLRITLRAPLPEAGVRTRAGHAPVRVRSGSRRLRRPPGRARAG